MGWPEGLAGGLARFVGPRVLAWMMLGLVGGWAYVCAGGECGLAPMGIGSVLAPMGIGSVLGLIMSQPAITEAEATCAPHYHYTTNRSFPRSKCPRTIVKLCRFWRLAHLVLLQFFYPPLQFFYPPPCSLTAVG